MMVPKSALAQKGGQVPSELCFEGLEPRGLGPVMMYPPAAVRTMLLDALASPLRAARCAEADPLSQLSRCSSTTGSWRQRE